MTSRPPSPRRRAGQSTLEPMIAVTIVTLGGIVISLVYLRQFTDFCSNVAQWVATTLGLL